MNTDSPWNLWFQCVGESAYVLKQIVAFMTGAL